MRSQCVSLQRDESRLVCIVLTVFCSFIVVSLRCTTDFGRLRKVMLIIVSLIGSISTGLLFTVGDGLWIYGGALILVANVCYGLTSLFYNAFLPLLARVRDKLRLVFAFYPP